MEEEGKIYSLFELRYSSSPALGISNPGSWAFRLRSNETTGFPSLQLTDNRSWNFLWRTLTSTSLIQKVFYISYLLLCNKNNAALVVLNRTHLWSHGFGGSGVPMWCSWVRYSESNQTANQILAKLHSFLELRVLFQSHVVVGRIQFFVIVQMTSSLLNRWKLGVFLSASYSLWHGPLTTCQLTSSRLARETVSLKESSLWLG